MLTFPSTAPVVPDGYLGGYLWAAVVVALFYLAPLGGAWRLVRALVGDSAPIWMRLVLSVVLAPMLMALLLLAAGLANGLVVPVVIGVILGLALAHLGVRREIVQACGETAALVRRAGPGPKALGAVCAGLSLAMLLSAAGPVVDEDCVSPMGHLTVSVMYAEAGGLPIAEGNVNFGASHLYHLLLTALYLLGAPAGPAILAASQTIMLAIVVGAFAALWWGSWAGPIAAFLLLASGLVARWGHVPRTDVPVALLGATSVFLWVLWRERPSHRLLLATSLFAGLAAAAKITWWLVLPAQALLVMAYPGAKLRARLRHAVVFSILPLVLIAPWIARSQILTGTPVYPLTWRYTGGKYWTEAQDNWYEEWFRDWCTRKHPSFLHAPRGVPGHTYETLRSDWPQGAIVGLCLVALLFRRPVRGPVVPLVLGAAVAWLAVVGFLDGDPRHYLAAIAVGATVAGGAGAAVACGLGARAAGDVGASTQCGRLPKLGLTLVLLVAAGSAIASRSAEPFLLPEFLYGSDRGPMAIARTVGKKRPEGECQLWVNQRSPQTATVFTASKWSFYLRRQSVVLPLVLAEKVPLRQIPELLDERGVDYIVLDPTQDDESDPWWAGRWQEEHLRSTWELTRAARAALTAEVVYGTEWVRAYEGQKGWYVYRRATPSDTHFPDPGRG